jgi:hypothetical protein
VNKKQLNLRAMTVIDDKKILRTFITVIDFDEDGSKGLRNVERHIGGLFEIYGGFSVGFGLCFLEI